MTAALEKHYRVKELAALWSLSTKTITRIFAHEPGVIQVTSDFSTKRKYATLSIPESVALRVHERLGQQPLQAALPGVNPLRVVHLRDLDAGVPKKTRHVVKLKAG